MTDAYILMTTTGVPVAAFKHKADAEKYMVRLENKYALHYEIERVRFFARAGEIPA